LVTDWNAEAARAANHVYTHHFEAHRGALPWGTQGLCAVFGNDGYTTDSTGRAAREVEFVRERLQAEGLTELGFGVCGEGYSWALIVQTVDDQWLTGVVSDAWYRACGPPAEPDLAALHRAAQTAIAADSLADHDAGNLPSIN
jgi:hypothetical protein